MILDTEAGPPILSSKTALIDGKRLPTPKPKDEPIRALLVHWPQMSAQITSHVTTSTNSRLAIVPTKNSQVRDKGGRYLSRLVY